LPAASESSPVIDRDRVVFGSQDGTVYALSAGTGHTIWSYSAAGAVKASPTLSGGRVFFGDYSGHVTALDADTGRPLWVELAPGTDVGSSTFYSTAAASNGRIFLGNTNGAVYAYRAATGALDWMARTGAYVYASPAITDIPGVGPTVLIGSYDQHFYALNATTGRTRWSYDVGGRVSGSATVVGGIVYLADLANRRTLGLAVATGASVFHFADGGFDPAITDGHILYLTGYNTLYAVAPR
jgi:outer membrane protein assembly factor BamB